MMRQRPTYQVVISDLERILKKESQRQGVEIKQVEIGGPQDPHLEGFDLVVAADGSNSLIREGLGIERLLASDARYFVAGSIRTPSQSRLRLPWKRRSHGQSRLWRYIRYDEDHRSLVHSVIVGHGKKEQTWVVTQVPESDEVAAHSSWDKETTLKRFLTDAGKLLDKNLASKDLIWGGDRAFKVQSWYAERVVDGRYVLIGDAARGGHFMTSGGDNVGVVADVNALESYVKDGNRISFTHNIWTGTHAWLGTSRYLIDLYETSPASHVRSRAVTNNPSGFDTTRNTDNKDNSLFLASWFPLFQWVGTKGYSDRFKGMVAELRMSEDKEFGLEVMRSTQCNYRRDLIRTGLLTKAEVDYLRQGCYVDQNNIPIDDLVIGYGNHKPPGPKVPENLFKNPYSSSN